MFFSKILLMASVVRASSSFGEALIRLRAVNFCSTGESAGFCSAFLSLALVEAAGGGYFQVCKRDADATLVWASDVRWSAADSWRTASTATAKQVNRILLLIIIN